MNDSGARVVVAMVKQHNAKLTEIERAAREAMRDTAKEVLAHAKKNVPVDQGELRRSGKIGVSDTNVYIRFTAPHAWLQHERLDYQHSQGGAKYLERAVDEVGIEGAIIDGVAARLHRG